MPPLRLDSRRPKTSFAEYASHEARFRALSRGEHPEEAEKLMLQAQHDVDERWRLYEKLAEIGPAEAAGD